MGGVWDLEYMMKNEAKVSIIIPVYNGSNYLSEAIDSALAQDYGNIEVIVVNDGSNDGGKTADIARRYGERIRYLEKPNGGVASALNLGIREMTGEYFSWLSHDDLYLPKKISRQMKLLKKCGNPRQIVAGGYYIINEKYQPLAVMDFYSLYPKKKLETPLFPVFHCAVNGCTMLIHKSHFERVGLFDEKLLTTQDYDLWFRMLRGQKLLYTRGIDVISRAFEGQTSQRLREDHEKECTGLWMGMFDALTREERIEIGGSEELFYADMYDHFSKYTSYENVACKLKERVLGPIFVFSYRINTGVSVRIYKKMQMNKLMRSKRNR